MNRRLDQNRSLPQLCDLRDELDRLARFRPTTATIAVPSAPEHTSRCRRTVLESNSARPADHRPFLCLPGVNGIVTAWSLRTGRTSAR